MSTQPTTTPDSNWEQLLKIGIDYVKVSQPAWIFIAAVAGIQVLSILLMFSGGMRGAGGGFGLLSILSSVATLLLSLLLVRHALTGEFAIKDGDGLRILKLVGVGLLLAIALAIVGGFVFGIFAAILGHVGVMIGGLLTLAAYMFVFARLSFYLPALAVDHTTSITLAYAQSEPYWGRLIAVMLAPAVAAFVLNYLMVTLAPSFLGILLATLVSGVVGAAGFAVTLAALAYLYASHIRKTGLPAAT